MKLESLRSSKFETFKAYEIDNPLQVIGGYWQSTTYTNPGGGGGPDIVTNETIANSDGTMGKVELFFSPRPNSSNLNQTTFLQTLSNNGTKVFINNLSGPDIQIGSNVQENIAVTTDPIEPNQIIMVKVLPNEINK